MKDLIEECNNSIYELLELMQVLNEGNKIDAKMWEKSCSYIGRRPGTSGMQCWFCP